MSQIKRREVALKESGRPLEARRAERGGEQSRAEQEDKGRAAEGADRPHGIGKGAAPAAEFQRELARAKRKRRQHRDGDGGAGGHGKGRRHAGPEHTLRQREDEHEDPARAWPDADREHHGEDLSPGERPGELARIDDVTASLALIMIMVMIMVISMAMMVVMMVVLAVSVIVPGMVRMNLGRTRPLPAPEDGDELRRQQPSADERNQRVLTISSWFDQALICRPEAFSAKARMPTSATAVSACSWR